MHNSYFSGGVGGAQQRPGCLCDRRGATGQGEAGETVRPQEDQTCRYDRTLTRGKVSD